MASTIAAHEELCERAPEALLPCDEARWPAALATCFTDSGLRERLAAAQRAALGTEPRRRWFADDERLYREVMREGLDG